MKRAFWSALAIAAVVAAPGFAEPQRGSQAPAAGAVVSSDKPIDKQIEKQFKADPSLKHADVHVKVADGVATLTGTVTTEAEKARAGQLAKVSGVSRVDNQILVDPYASTSGTSGKLGEKAKEGAGKVKEGAKETANATKKGVGKAAGETTDAYILSRVKSRFVGVDVLKGSDINVDCDEHVVTLKGTVPTEAARARAIELAKGTEGVHEVVDRLTVGPKR